MDLVEICNYYVYKLIIYCCISIEHPSGSCNERSEIDAFLALSKLTYKNTTSSKSNDHIYLYLW